MREAWVHAIGSTAVLLENAAANRLPSCGITPCALGPECPARTGIVFFEKLTAELLDLISESSCSGLYRVLAVAVSSACVAGTTSWQLLHHGASDVFAWVRGRTPGGAAGRGSEEAQRTSRI